MPPKPAPTISTLMFRFPAALDPIAAIDERLPPVS
jgi:hypothetical protein